MHQPATDVPNTCNQAEMDAGVFRTILVGEGLEGFPCLVGTCALADFLSPAVRPWPALGDPGTCYHRRDGTSMVVYDPAAPYSLACAIGLALYSSCRADLAQAHGNIEEMLRLRAHTDRYARRFARAWMLPVARCRGYTTVANLAQRASVPLAAAVARVDDLIALQEFSPCTIQGRVVTPEELLARWRSAPRPAPESLRTTETTWGTLHEDPARPQRVHLQVNMHR